MPNGLRIYPEAPPTSMRRRARIWSMTLDTLVVVLKSLDPESEERLTIEGLPADAEFVDIRFDSNSFEAMVCSDQFDEVPDGKPIPYMEWSLQIEPAQKRVKFREFF